MEEQWSQRRRDGVSEEEIAIEEENASGTGQALLPEVSHLQVDCDNILVDDQC